MKKSEKRRKTITCILLLIIPILIIILFLIRLISSTEIDDVTPGIPCPEIEIYNPDVLYVIPNYNNNSISESNQWCKYILSLNKEIEMHGITHKYREFLYQNISQEDLNFGISEFERCFAFKPRKFKSPQLELSNENKQLLIENNLKIERLFHQLTHKVYHCNDSDRIKNKAIKIF